MSRVVLLIVATALFCGCASVRVVELHPRAGAGYIDISQEMASRNGCYFTGLPIYIDGLLVDRQNGSSTTTRVAVNPGPHTVAAQLQAAVDVTERERRLAIADVGKDPYTSKIARLRTTAVAGAVCPVKIVGSSKPLGGGRRTRNVIVLKSEPKVPYVAAPWYMKRSDKLNGDAYILEDMALSPMLKRILSELGPYKEKYNGVYLAGDTIPYKKLMNAAEACGIALSEEKVLCLIDATVLGSARNCLLITSKGVHARNAGLAEAKTRMSLSYEEFCRQKVSEFNKYNVSIGSFNFGTAGLALKNAKLVELLKDVQVSAAIL